MINISPKDQKFLYWTLVGSLLFMAFLHILNPMIQPPAPDAPPREKVVAVSEQIITIRASEVASLLRNDSGKSSLVFVYASWCAYCKQMMPDLVDLVRGNQLSQVNLLFLSVDNRKLQLATYIAQYGYEDTFTPYMVKGSAVNSLADVLKSVGGSYNGAIPYIASISSNGRLLGEDFGLITRSRILDLANLNANQ
jgi:thiol-disulfide isomerase/thioredoxin